MGRRHIMAALAACVLAAVAPTAADAAAANNPIPTWAYYYIWYNATSWNRAKRDYPLLGRYSSDQASVMRAHVRLAQQAGIDGFIVSWKSTPVLNRRLRLLAGIAGRRHFHLAVIYQGLDFYRRPLPIARVARDLRHFSRTFARLPAFRGDGRPTVIWSGSWMFTPRALASVTAPLRGRLRMLASERNPSDYLAKASAFDGDAYYWSSVNPATYHGYAAKLAALGRAVHRTGGWWLAPAAPGFDGRLVGHPTVVDRRGGRTLRQELDVAEASNPDVVALISWNEFSENSHVEPSRNNGTRALDVLADRNGTTLSARAEIDSSQPSAARPAGLGAIPAVLVFVVAGLGTVWLLGRGWRGHAR
jgi:hypothetical protein